jgi:hypothetical protein
MATITYKTLGQAAPAAATDTDLYTVPAATSTVVSSVIIANRGGAATLVRLAVRPAGAAIASKHYLIYDYSLDTGDSIDLTAGITLATTDVLTVRDSVGTASFNAFGSEKS